MTQTDGAKNMDSTASDGQVESTVVVNRALGDGRYRWRSSDTPKTLTDAGLWFLSWQQAQNRSDNTIEAYRKAINTVGSILSNLTGQPVSELPIELLNRNDLTDAFTEYSATHAPSSQRQARTVWNGICELLCDYDVIDKNPMSRIPPAHGGRGNTVPKALPPEAVEALLSYLASPEDANRRPNRRRWRERDHAFVLLFLVTGMRESEMVGANVGDLAAPYGYEGARTIIVRGKGDKERLLNIEKPVVDVLEHYLSTRAERLPQTTKSVQLDDLARGEDRDVWSLWDMEAPLFVDADGKRMTGKQIYRRVEAIYREAGITNYRTSGALVHQLRHTVATNLANDPNVTVYQLRHLLGHSSLSATQRYTSGAGRNTREAAARNPVYRLLDS